jgi:mannitol/fructose-specific phosphotransferase system IIA component (Ntr-type)
MILLFVTVFDPAKIAKLASAFLLMLFAFNCLAVIVMRESQIDSYDPGFKSPWYPWMQIVGIIAPLAMIMIMGWLPIAFTAGLVVVGICWFWYYGKPRVNRGGAIFHLFARLGQRRFEGLDRELRSILKEKGLRTDDPYDEVVVDASVIDESGDVNFEHLVHRASEQLAVRLPISADQLASSFMEGTRVGATPVSHGAALPHQRLPNLDKPLMVLARSARGVTVDVQFDFIDHAHDQMIHAVIFLISPEEDAAQHLRILAQVAKRIDDDQFITDWLAAPNEESIKQILLRDERFVSILLDPQLPTGNMIDKPVRDLGLPEGSLVAMVHRGGRMIVPRGSTMLQSGDSITIIGETKAIAQLRTRFES